MVAFTIVFIALYSSVLFGWVRPFADITIITRIEPIIFMIIGYFFGRLPLQGAARVLREELTRQKVKADAAQHAKENIEIEKEVMIEKIRNARAALLSFEKDGVSAVRSRNPADGNFKDPEGGLYSSIRAAVRILGI